MVFTIKAWSQWRMELAQLETKRIPRYYFRKESDISTIELHGFCDASEQAYGAVVYLRMIDTNGDTQVSLVTSKTKVAPIKRLTIPRLELCRAYVLAQLLHHVQRVVELPLKCVYAWTDSTIVLSWLVGNPRRFKTYCRQPCFLHCGSHSPDRWNHVVSPDNPADCASRGMFPSELLRHDLWWNGPLWLKSTPERWPKLADLPPAENVEERQIVLHATTQPVAEAVIEIDRYSSFMKLKHVTAWIVRFIRNSREIQMDRVLTPSLDVEEIRKAEDYWIKMIQRDYFYGEIQTLERKSPSLKASNSLTCLNPFVDSSGLLRVGGRQSNSLLSFSQKHPLIIHGRHPLTKLLIRTEHLRLLHAGLTLLSSSLSCHYYIVGVRSAVRNVTRNCTIFKRYSSKPGSQQLGQLPIERITPDLVFNRVGLDYAGPLFIKYGSVRKPTVIKTYVCVFVSLSVKAVHLELVSDLTSQAFIAALRRFISRRGKPTLLWSDNGTNFVGANREIKELYGFLKQQVIQQEVSEFCSCQGISWKFIPGHAPHFGGLWEAAVKGMKTHIKKVVSSVKLTFEEMYTVLTQIESCLNSRPLVPLPSDEDGVEALTPGHFLIGRSLELIPDPAYSYRNLTLLSRWNLCQSLVRHFWSRWSREYLKTLQRYTKWKLPSRNIQVGDIVIVCEDNVVPAKWPLGRIVETFPEKDELVRVVKVKTVSGTYKRPTSKIALLLKTNRWMFMAGGYVWT